VSFALLTALALLKRDPLQLRPDTPSANGADENGAVGPRTLHELPPKERTALCESRKQR
jgi:hypothetical protein